MKTNYRPLSDKETEQDRFLKGDAYLRAQKRVNKILGFYRHLIIYLIINTFLIILVTYNSDGPFWRFETFSTAIFWGIGLAFHAMGAFGSDWLFGKNWENRKIKEYMDKENRRWE